jgi:hypothetical protein
MRATRSAMNLLFAVTLLASCGHEGADSHQHDAAGHASHSHNDASEGGLDGIVLSDGSKWEMDDHTRSVFAKMAASFVSTDLSSLQEDGLKQAGSELQEDINALIQGCTMTGAAHDQLHVYLGGYMPAVAALSDSGRVEDAKKVQHYLEQYGNYFE